MKHLPLVLLLLSFSLVACAYKRIVTPSSVLPDASFHQNKETALSALDQTQSNHGEDEEEFFFEETDEEMVQVADPLSPWNRAMFHFNDRFYFWVLKPVTRGYRVVIPKPVRSGVKNFFYNITTPIRMASCILQGKGRAVSGELARFLINSTVGVLGFGNPAKRWAELNPSEEDLGQTLAVYGIGNGFYIVWPILGPSTLRDSVGMVGDWFLGDWFLSPVSYVHPIEVYLGMRAIETVNDTSFRIGDYEALKEAAIDPYVALRNAYIQLRKKKVVE